MPVKPPRREGNLRRFIRIFALVGIAVGLAFMAALFIAQRLRTGEWTMPDGETLVYIKKGGEQAPPRQIVLFRGPIAIASGVEDANQSQSSILAKRAAPYQLPGFKGSNKTWGQVVACVREMFSRYDVAVVEARPPPGTNHILVAVGGKPSDIAIKTRTTAGLAPFNTEVIANAVVFAFSQTLGNRVRPICDTIAMEVAHAYGLDHEYLCNDPMTYLAACGKRAFQDKDAPCGEKKKRACADGQPTQNSHQRLLKVLGPARVAAK